MALWIKLDYFNETSVTKSGCIIIYFATDTRCSVVGVYLDINEGRC